MDTFDDAIRSRLHDDHPGLLTHDAEYSWHEVVVESGRRGQLVDDLVVPDRPRHVGVLLENTPEYLFWINGAAMAGAATVGLNSTRRGEELARDVRHTDCQAVVTDRAHLPLLEGADLGDAAGRIWLVDSDEHHERLAQTDEALPDGQVPGDRIALLLFTSGSTGAPKAVIASQGRMAATCATAAQMFGLGRDDISYQSMPMFHGNALMANIGPSMIGGATVSMRRRFSASGFLPDVRRFGATFFNYVGRSLAYILATEPTDHDADNRLRLGFGTEASRRDRERFEARFGCRLVESYGSSEGTVVITPTEDTPEGALGVPPSPDADVVVLDPDTGEECPPAEFDEHGRLLNGDEAIGEIVARGAAERFEGYYGNPEAEAERLRDGNYHTGDLAYRDAAGVFYFAGRDADLLRVDSENLAAAPVERLLLRYEPVVMAGVYAVPDAVTGDQVMAALELHEGEAFDPDDFAAFLADQPDLGTKWAPRFVRVVEPMPLTATNKIDKAPLRRGGWQVDDPVWYRPGRELAYRRMTDEDAAALREAFVEHDRVDLLPAGSP